MKRNATSACVNGRSAATRASLDVYLVRNAARRVLAGASQRGQGELIDAALWFSDMRDFTALSDRKSPGEVIAVLDAYFDAAVSAIAAHGGEVLKFIGEAVLAIFPVADNAKSACTGRSRRRNKHWRRSKRSTAYERPPARSPARLEWLSIEDRRCTETSAPEIDWTSQSSRPR